MKYVRSLLLFFFLPSMIFCAERYEIITVDQNKVNDERASTSSSSMSFDAEALCQDLLVKQQKKSKGLIQEAYLLSSYEREKSQKLVAAIITILQWSQQFDEGPDNPYNHAYKFSFARKKSCSPEQEQAYRRGHAYLSGLFFHLYDALQKGASLPKDIASLKNEKTGMNMLHVLSRLDYHDELLFPRYIYDYGYDEYRYDYDKYDYDEQQNLLFDFIKAGVSLDEKTYKKQETPFDTAIRWENRGMVIELGSLLPEWKNESEKFLKLHSYILGCKYRKRTKKQQIAHAIKSIKKGKKKKHNALVMQQKPTHVTDILDALKMVFTQTYFKEGTVDKRGYTIYRYYHALTRELIYYLKQSTSSIKPYITIKNDFYNLSLLAFVIFMCDVPALRELKKLGADFDEKQALVIAQRRSKEWLQPVMKFFKCTSGDIKKVITLLQEQ